MHYYYVEDEQGDLVDLIPFCCDSCHREWCRKNSLDYGGWSGCNESDSPEWCHNCGVRCNVGNETECDWTCAPLTVNLIGPMEGACEHGVPNWIDTKDLVW